MKKVEEAVAEAARTGMKKGPYDFLSDKQSKSGEICFTAWCYFIIATCKKNEGVSKLEGEHCTWVGK